MLFNKKPELLTDIMISRPIGILVGALAFVLTIMIAATFALHHFFDVFQKDLHHNAVFEVTLSQGEIQQTNAILTALQQYLHAQSFVREAHIIPMTGDGQRSQTAFIETRFYPNTPFSIDDILHHLRSITPHIHAQSNAFMRANLAYLYDSLRYFSYGVIVLIAFTMMGTISFVTRSGLRLHRSVIDVLRLIGAPNRYIAAQFQWNAFRLGLSSSLLGILCGTALFALLTWLGKGIDINLFALSHTTFLVLGGLPLCIGLLSLFVARVEVFRTLSILEDVQ